MTRLLIVSSSRADVGILSPIWNRMAASSNVDTHVLLTGMHMSNDSFAREHLPAGLPVYIRGNDLLGTDALTAAVSMGEISRECAGLYEEISPDMILLTGDRLDMFPAATAAMSFNIPLAHLHGGEVTLGAIDERLRHAMTKLSHIHFAATAESASRICSMGEEPWRVHVSGAPGLDTLRAMGSMDRSDLMYALGFDNGEHGPLRLIGLHPETNGNDPIAPMKTVLEALDTLPPAPTVFTAPNSDPGGQRMRHDIEGFIKDRRWARFHDTLGSELYANSLKHAAILVGNSSSGIIEAPLFTLPFVCVGRRQEGRLRGMNTVETPCDSNLIAKAIEGVLTRTRPSFVDGKSPYGDGHAAPRIAKVLEALPSREKMLDKAFWASGRQFDTPWEHVA